MSEGVLFYAEQDVQQGAADPGVGVLPCFQLPDTPLPVFIGQQKGAQTVGQGLRHIPAEGKILPLPLHC